VSKRAKEAWASIAVAIFAGSDALTKHAAWHRILAAALAGGALVTAARVPRRPAKMRLAGPVQLPAGATPVEFPSLGGSARSGQIIRWFKAAGDYVHAGEPLVEVEQEKVTVEMPAPTSGVLCDAFAPLGRDIDTGTAIAGILASDSAAVIATELPTLPH
jgi:2-oxoglutarate dehydrogenase E2 component (dihydrolipoamide succinyltransferase)